MTDTILPPPPLSLKEEKAALFINECDSTNTVSILDHYWRTMVVKRSLGKDYQIQKRRLQRYYTFFMSTFDYSTGSLHKNLINCIETLD